MLDFNELFLAFASIAGLSAGTYLLGSLIELLVKKIFSLQNGNCLNIFWRILTGTSLLLSSYAVWSTKGLSILLIVPILLVFFVRQMVLNNEQSRYFNAAQQWMFFALSVVVNFSFYVWALHSFNNDVVHYVSGDFNIYFRIAQRLNTYGIESLNLDPIYAAQFAAPYHYGDLWLYAFVSKMVSTNPSIVFLVAFTHLSVVFINGVYTYAYKRFNDFTKGKNGYLYLLLLAGFFTGFGMFFPKFIVPSAESYTLSVMNWSKVLTPSCFLIAMLMLAKDRNWWALCFIAMIGALSFINAMPAMFMTVFFILTISLMRKQITAKKWFLYHGLYVGGTVIFVVALYKLIPDLMGVNAKEATGVEMHKALYVKQYLGTAIKIFIGGWFQVFVLTPFLLILFIGLLRKAQFNQLKNKLFAIDNDLLFLFFTIFSGLSCWALLHPFAPDAVQFYTNILAPVYAIAVSFIVMYIIYILAHKLLSAVAIVVLLLSIADHYKDVFFIQKDNTKEWSAIHSFFRNKNSGFYFANLRPTNHFNSFFDKNTVYFMPLGQLLYIWPQYHNFSLNAPFLTENKASLYAHEEKIELELAPFSIFLRKSKAINPALSSDQIIQNFVQQQKIGYLTISKDTVLPHYFRPLVKDSLVLSNANLTVYRIR